MVHLHWPGMVNTCKSNPHTLVRASTRIHRDKQDNATPNFVARTPSTLSPLSWILTPHPPIPCDLTRYTNFFRTIGLAYHDINKRNTLGMLPNPSQNLISGHSINRKCKQHFPQNHTTFYYNHSVHATSRQTHVGRKIAKRKTKIITKPKTQQTKLTCTDLPPYSKVSQ